jgi:uncharacterized GH25 family protein
MKRLLAAVPLIALLLGLAVYIARKPALPSAPAQAPAGESKAPLASLPPVLSKPAPQQLPAATPSAPVALGAIRFVISMRGQPVSNAQITVQRGGTEEIRKFKPEADGTQLLQGLPPGEYGYKIHEEDAISFGGLLVVPPGETILVNAELKRGGRVSGTVTDRSGHPISNTRVLYLNPTTKAPAGDGTETDEKGQFALKGLPPGALAIRFRHDEFKPLDRTGIFINGADDDIPLDVVLEVGAKFSGRVVDEAGSPIEGAQVIAGNVDSAGLAKSAKDGSFTVTGLTEAPANVSAGKSGYGKVVKRNLPGNSTDVLFRLPKSGTILGRLIIDQIPRQTQITLSTYDEDLKQVIPADSRFFTLPTTATFRFDDVPPGTYWVDVVTEAYVAVDRPQVAVASGQVTPETRITMRKKN